MSKSDDAAHEKQVELPQGAIPAPTAPQPAADAEAVTGSGVTATTRRWRREDMLKRLSLALRGVALLFSLLAFIIMCSNTHGYMENFDKYEEYRYLLAVAILSTLYTGAQALWHVFEISTGKQLLQRRASSMVDFFGDQIVSYLLISSASSAVPLSNRMREGADDVFTNSSAAAISMTFLAFFDLALSALISAYKLSS